MTDAEKKLINHLNNNNIPYEKWKDLYDNCIESSNINIINATINTNVILHTMLEENCYSIEIDELKRHLARLNKLDDNTKKYR